MVKADFEKQIVQTLGQIIEQLNVITNKQNELDQNFKMINERFDAIESKLLNHDKRFDSLSEQVAINTELVYTVSQIAKKTERNIFDINSIKDRLGN